MNYVTQFVFALMVALTPLLPVAALAHSDHHEPLAESQLVERAESHIRHMVADPDYFPELTLDASWNDELVTRVERKSARSLILAVEKQQADKTVYLYMNYYRRLHSANFSGDFEGWK